MLKKITHAEACEICLMLDRISIFCREAEKLSAVLRIEDLHNLIEKRKIMQAQKLVVMLQKMDPEKRLAALERVRLEFRGKIIQRH